MTKISDNIQALRIKDCEILNIASGIRAQDSIELRDRLGSIHPQSIHYHFWAKKLRPGFQQPEFNNDFATWAYNNLHDNKLAERLSLINPGMYSGIEDLRAKVIEEIDKCLNENGPQSQTKNEQQFHFIQSEIVLFDTGHEISKPEALSELLPVLSIGSIYYHFIDSKSKSENIPAWVSNAGSEYSALAERLIDQNPYFFTLSEYRTRLSQIFRNFFKGVNT